MTIAFDIFIGSLLIILFYAVIVILRLAKVLYRQKCPSCNGRLTRVHRSVGDKIITASTLGILPFKRYKCNHCGWNGIRWSDRKSKTKSKEE